MTLPELPKKADRREAKIDERVANWFYENYQSPVLLEVKMKGGRLSEHQKRLIASVSRTNKFKYKFPDGRERTPLDYIVIPKELNAVLAICDPMGGCECTINNKDKIFIKV